MYQTCFVGFLRDVANFAFKQFCTEITPNSLNNLLEIVQTPNVEANKMLFDQEDAEAGEGDQNGDGDAAEEEVEGIEVDEESE